MEININDEIELIDDILTTTPEEVVENIKKIDVVEASIGQNMECFVEMKNEIDNLKGLIQNYLEEEKKLFQELALQNDEMTGIQLEQIQLDEELEVLTVQTDSRKKCK